MRKVSKCSVVAFDEAKRRIERKTKGEFEVESFMGGDDWDRNVLFSMRVEKSVKCEGTRQIQGHYSNWTNCAHSSALFSIAITLGVSHTHALIYIFL